MNNLSSAQICNLALARVGVSMFINDIAENTNENNVCQRFYGTVLDRCLSDLPWNFATRYADLQDIGSPPSQWLYRYAYPSDCLAARKLILKTNTAVLTTNLFVSDPYLRTDLTLANQTDKIPFQIIEDESGGGLAIVTDAETPILIYTARIETTLLWSPKFVNAFAWLLASEIAPALSANPKYAESAGKAYEAAILNAGSANMNEGLEDNPATSEFVSIRS
jgi:hypothetical protein